MTLAGKSSGGCHRHSWRWASTHRTRGFTLVELLVVIGIIGVLVQLLLPAVQSAREAARRTTCKNQLRQFGLAAQMHLDTHGYFPSGGWSGDFVADADRGYGAEQPGGWPFSLLEYLELGALRDAAAGEDVTAEPLEPGYLTLLQSSPEVFYCPSRRPAAVYPFKTSGNGPWTPTTGRGVVPYKRLTKVDYAANSGDALYSAAEHFIGEPNMWVPSSYEALETETPRWTPTNDPDSVYYQTGVSYYRSEVRPAQITDGLSKTYLIGEKFLSPGLYEDVNVTNGPSMMGDNQTAWAGYEWDNHRVAWNPAASFSQGEYQPQADTDEAFAANIFAFGSAHPAALQMAMCDGSVTEVAYDITPETHRARAHRMDGGAF
ncbi:hypothetical protein Pla108_36480 [Botrimarina colliarenosi]|uniref:DUF1559 domain-containing protein n=1 Tax=Botrimarina colliarenosi TaxID=2528001 RepID=A0A5C6A698_9BACT|nr:DUF1559 domain-containing protein [Botrimarina colliarenosi]TWT94798.1 hypothetical protein Pla108_36480 [Botrimarina colliarenosi]